MNWELHRLQTPAAFQAHAADWDRLNRAGPNSPLLDSAFMQPLLDSFSSGGEFLACGAVDGEMSAMLILVSVGRTAWRTFQPAQAPLGACVRRASPEGVASWAPFLAGLLQALPGIATVLGITQQDPDLEARPADSARLHTLDYIRTARITIGGSFEAYWQARGKNLRQNLKKQRSRLDKDGVAIRLQLSTDVRDVAEAVADYGRLESTGWKAAGGTAVRADDMQGRFYRAMLENFCGTGHGRIYRYWYGERLAAMDLCIEGGDSLIVLKTAYDEQIADGSSPALLMRQEAVAQLFAEQRLARIEFYGKLLDWHTRWSDEVRTIFHLNVYRWQALKTLHGVARSMTRLVRADRPASPLTPS